VRPSVGIMTAPGQVGYEDVLPRTPPVSAGGVADELITPSLRRSGPVVDRHRSTARQIGGGPPICNHLPGESRLCRLLYRK
jgi:hypothetical protein